MVSSAGLASSVAVGAGAAAAAGAGAAAAAGAGSSFLASSAGLAASAAGAGAASVVVVAGAAAAAGASSFLGSSAAGAGAAAAGAGAVAGSAVQIRHQRVLLIWVGIIMFRLTSRCTLSLRGLRGSSGGGRSWCRLRGLGLLLLLLEDGLELGLQVVERVGSCGWEGMVSSWTASNGTYRSRRGRDVKTHDRDQRMQVSSRMSVHPMAWCNEDETRLSLPLSLFVDEGIACDLRTPGILAV